MGAACPSAMHVLWPGEPHGRPLPPDASLRPLREGYISPAGALHPVRPGRALLRARGCSWQRRGGKRGQRGQCGQCGQCCLCARRPCGRGR
eukprot:5719297-Alexandrium_andersonii.AAC.1